MDRPRSPDLASRLFGARPEHTLVLLQAAWPAAVGPEVARRTRVVALDRGILRIKVPDARWQRTLLRLRGDILSRLREVAGGAAPRGLGFVAGEMAEPPEPAPQPAAAPAPPPRPGLVEAARAIPDPEVRARFLASSALYLARFGGAQKDSAGPDTGPSTG